MSKPPMEIQIKVHYREMSEEQNREFVKTTADLIVNYLKAHPHGQGGKPNQEESNEPDPISENHG